MHQKVYRVTLQATKTLTLKAEDKNFATADAEANLFYETGWNWEAVEAEELDRESNDG